MIPVLVDSEPRVYIDAIVFEEKILKGGKNILTYICIVLRVKSWVLFIF